jgi:hypothetical protein
MSSTFPLQGEHMRRPSNVKNIVTLMSLGDPVTIVSKFIDQRMLSFNLTSYSSWYIDTICGL